MNNSCALRHLQVTFSAFLGGGGAVVNAAILRSIDHLHKWYYSALRVQTTVHSGLMGRGYLPRKGGQAASGWWMCEEVGKF